MNILDLLVRLIVSGKGGVFTTASPPIFSPTFYLAVELLLLFVAILTHELTHYIVAKYYRVEKRFFVKDYDMVVMYSGELSDHQLKVFYLSPLITTTIPCFLFMFLLVDFNLIWFPVLFLGSLGFSCFIGLQDIITFLRGKQRKNL